MKTTTEFRHKLPLPEGLQPQSEREIERLREQMRLWAVEHIPAARAAMNAAKPQAFEVRVGFTILHYAIKRPQMLPKQAEGASLREEIDDLVGRMYVRDWFVDYCFVIEVDVRAAEQAEPGEVVRRAGRLD